MCIRDRASTSSRIENYLGFPAGISGSELAERAIAQARRFGLRTAVPERALSLRHEDGRYVVALDSGDELAARTVVLATGADVYKRQIFDTNVKGSIFTVQKALPLMGEGSALGLHRRVESVEVVQIGDGALHRARCV